MTKSSLDGKGVSTPAPTVADTGIWQQLRFENAIKMERLAHQLAQVIGRSLIPLLALFIIFGTMLWGPWITLVVAAVLWYSIGHLV